ncbi:MAG: class SAM-dependent methyltransferase [Candidatus Peribacteria bacterium]|nr:class SAM-dependent methyltransferase [Candidatus Peribacteria bacterium]
MPDRRAIYLNQALQYDELISREDYEENILKTLLEIHDFNGNDIADIGAGTGRLALLLAPFVQSILLTDAAGPMLKVAEERLAAIGFTNFRTEVSDLTSIPAENASLNAVLESWALAGAALRSESWPDTVQKAVKEMERVVKPGGSIILMETLGTGLEEPSPPNEKFAALYESLEKQHGFSHRSIRTDYKFTTAEEKDRLLTFFFDKEMLDAGVHTDSMIYPECTGVWWKTV